MLGKQPESKVQDWNEGRKTSFLSGSNTYEIYDKTRGQLFEATGVYDPATGKTWIVATDGYNQNHYFYLVNDNKSTDRIMSYVDNGRTILYGGHFEKFDTPDEIRSKQNNQIADGMATAAFATAAIVTAAPAVVNLTSIYLAGGEGTAIINAALGDPVAAYATTGTAGAVGAAGAYVMSEGEAAETGAMEAGAAETSLNVEGASEEATLSNPTSTRSTNKLMPDPEATGDHTVFKRGDKDQIYKYQTYEKTRTGNYNPTIRYDGGKPDGSPGAPHKNIPTPHVQGKAIKGGTRIPTSKETPKKN